jgi:Holliday junction resolvasome RuvABC endonuclease subunit
MAKYIKKIGLESIETFLGEKLKKNYTVIGVDVSQHSTGLALIRTTDSYLIIEKLIKIQVPRNVELLKSVDMFLSQLNDFKREISQFKLDCLVIEDCFFGMNVNTLKALARFGILVYVTFRELIDTGMFLLPSSVRKKVGFKKSDKKAKGQALKKELVHFVNVGFGLKLRIKDNDLADSILLGLAGLVV